MVAKGRTILLTGPAGSASQLLLSRSMTPFLPVVLVFKFITTASIIRLGMMTHAYDYNTQVRARSLQ